MCVVAETLDELLEVLVQKRVVGDLVDPAVQLILRRKLAVQQQVGDLQKCGALGELLDRVAAVFEDAGVAVDVGDRASAGGGVHEPWIVSGEPRLIVDSNLFQICGPNRAVGDRDLILLTRPVVADAERIGHAVNLRWRTSAGLVGEPMTLLTLPSPPSAFTLTGAITGG